MSCIAHLILKPKTCAQSKCFLTAILACLLAARIFGPGPTIAKSLQKPPHKDLHLSSPKHSIQTGLSRQSFASSALKRVPTSRLLQKTLQSSQHYLQHLRGASVPRLAQQAGPQTRNIGESSPKAALAHLRKPFNYVLGQSVSNV